MEQLSQNFIYIMFNFLFRIVGKIRQPSPQNLASGL